MTLTEMRDYVIGQGWGYIGTCGCSTNMYKYSKSDKVGFEIRIGTRADLFQIREWGRTVRQGNGSNFLEYYAAIFGN